MNNPNTKSSILNTSGANFAILLWIGALISSFGPASFIVALICIAILLFERSSDYLRNHASQILSLSIIYTILDIVFYLLFNTKGWGFLAIFAFITGIIATLLKLILIILKIAFYLIGLSKSFERKDVQIPFLAEFGNSLERSITPESL